METKTASAPFSRDPGFRHYATPDMPAAQKAREWSNAVSSIFFPLDVRFDDPARFSGALENWSLGKISLSRFRSHPVHYTRDRRHLKYGSDEDILVTFARHSDTVFSQDGVTLTCGRNQFVIERSHSPYEFVQKDANELWVLKIPLGLLRQRLRSLERYTAYVFDAGAGVGGLLSDTLPLLPNRIARLEDAARESVGTYVLDLLVLAVESDTQVLASRAPSVRTAHLARIERFIRQNLANRTLSPETVASHCGISVRYLHDLFAANGTSVSRWIRVLRLGACEQQLREARRLESIAEIAYRWGFGDQAQFSRHFRAHFGCAPSQLRDRARGRPKLG